MQRKTILRNCSVVICARAYPTTSRSRGTSLRFHSWKMVGRIFLVERLPSAPKMQMVARSEREMGEKTAPSSPICEPSSSESELSSVGGLVMMFRWGAQDGRLAFPTGVWLDEFIRGLPPVAPVTPLPEGPVDGTRLPLGVEGALRDMGYAP